MNIDVIRRSLQRDRGGWGGGRQGLANTLFDRGPIAFSLASFANDFYMHLNKTDLPAVRFRF